MNNNANTEIKTVYIKKWFLLNLKSEFHYNLNFFTNQADVIHETEKAYKVLIECSSIDGEWDGTKSVWVPKSCTMTKDEYLAEIEASKKRFEDGCKVYQELIAYAQKMGVKGVREGLRKETILRKIEAAGVAIPA